MLLVVGEIVRPHGVRGEVIVEVRTDAPQQRYAVGSVLTTDPTAAGPLTIERAHPHPAAGPGRYIVAFEGVHDRAFADGLRGVRLCVDSADVPPPEDPDEFHDYQLVGMVAVSPEGEPLGEVVGIEHAPASELLVLRRPDGGSALVPFVKAIVPEVDLARRRVVVAAPPGLLDL